MTDKPADAGKAADKPDLLDKAKDSPPKGAPPPLIDQLVALDTAAGKQGSSVSEILIQAGKALLGLDLTTD